MTTTTQQPRRLASSARLASLPTLNHNGTAKSVLSELNSKAIFALDTALQAMKVAAPNGRDYPVYPADDMRSRASGSDYDDAAAQHRARCQKVRDVLIEIVDIGEHIADQPTNS